MSIFPKRVCIGDNVIIHIKCVNSSNAIDHLKIFLKVISPSGIEYNLLDGEMWKIPLASSCGALEKYYLFKVTDSCEAGKYFVKLWMKKNNKIIPSTTKESDYFYVDKINVYKEKNKVILKNESLEITKVKLIFNQKIENIHLFGKGKISVNGKNLKAIMYGNKDIYELHSLYERGTYKLKKKKS